VAVRKEEKADRSLGDIAGIVADVLTGDATLDTRRTALKALADAPLTALHRLIDSIRERERDEPSAPDRQEWLVIRGAVHAMLARRDSRVALYDLRETFEAAPAALPVDFLSAMTAIGDASCLEPLARASTASPGDEWWRGHLQQAARAIIGREKLTARSAALKRVRAKYPAFLEPNA
jgi:hypothetical protein